MARREPVRRGPVATLGTALCWVGVAAALVTGLSVAAEGAAAMEVVRAVALPLGLIVIGVSMI